MREHTIDPPNTGSTSLNVITALTVAGAIHGPPNLAALRATTISA